MVIGVFGKNGCELCQQTKRKLSHFLTKWGVSDDVPVSFYDMDTVDGMAEGMFYDVDAIPVTIVLDDTGQVIWRCDGKRPSSKDLRPHLVGDTGGVPD
jgi:hypothetical protein